VAQGVPGRLKKETGEIRNKEEEEDEEEGRPEVIPPLISLGVSSCGTASSPCAEGISLGDEVWDMAFLTTCTCHTPV
jgi:hypothetical protein